MQIQIKISEKLFLRDPESTELGRKILPASIDLIDRIGFERFTFKKLAKEIPTTEASLYRYFENKHKLLIYLISWYWSWLSYRLMFETHRIESSEEKLRIAIRVFCHTVKAEMAPATVDLDITALYRIVVAESPKAYLTKEVDEVNKEGAYLSYKVFCKSVSDYVKEINPKFLYPTALISTAVEAAHHQKYFSEHLPSLTEVSPGSMEEVTDFLTDMIFRVVCLSPEQATTPVK